MKATVNTEQFKDALKTVISVCKGQAITECLVTFGGEGVVLEGACLGAYVRQLVQGTVEEPGAFVTNASYLSGLRLAAKETTLEGAKNRIRCVSGRAKYEVEVVQDTVRIESQRPLRDIPIAITLPAQLLTSAISRTAFTPSLNSQLDVKVETADNQLKLTVNDEFRAAFYKASVPVQAPFKVCLPISFISAVASRIKGVVQMGVVEGMFKIADSTLTACHPIRTPRTETDIEAFILQLEQAVGQFTTAVLETEELTAAIDSASSIVAGTVGYEVRLEIDLAKEKPSKVFVKSAIGESECQFNFESLTGDSHLVLSSKYLSEFLHLINNKDKLRLDIHAGLILIKTTSSPSDSLVLVMPQIESGV